VPDRTISLNGNDFEITTIGRVGPGDDINVETTAPTGEDYTLQFRNSDGQRVSFTDLHGDNSTILSTKQLPPGTYAMLIRADREYKALHPVIVSGYTSNIDLQNNLTTNAPFTATINLQERENAPTVDSVNAYLIDNGEIVEQKDASRQNGDYTVEFTAPNEERDFQIVTGVLGKENIAGTSQKEILELDERTFTKSSLDIKITQSSIQQIGGQKTAVINTTIENTGDFSANEKTNLIYNGNTVDTIQMELNGSEQRVATFTHGVGTIDADEVEFIVQSKTDSQGLSIDLTSSSDSNSGGSDSTTGGTVSTDEESNAANSTVNQTANQTDTEHDDTNISTTNNTSSSSTKIRQDENPSDGRNTSANSSTANETGVQLNEDSTPGYGLLSAVTALLIIVGSLRYKISKC
jgi:hypothetical protein